MWCDVMWCAVEVDDLDRQGGHIQFCRSIKRTYCWSFIDDILMVSKTTRESTIVSRTRTGEEESVTGHICFHCSSLYSTTNILMWNSRSNYRKNQQNLFGYGYRHESHIFLNCEDQASKFCSLTKIRVIFKLYSKSAYFVKTEILKIM